jgi:ribonuclease HI
LQGLPPFHADAIEKRRATGGRAEAISCIEAIRVAELTLSVELLTDSEEWAMLPGVVTKRMAASNSVL